VGGKVTLPPTDTFYSTFHAAVKDKFGVDWNIVADEAQGEPA
jgi:PhnB protein